MKRDFEMAQAHNETLNAGMKDLQHMKTLAEHHAKEMVGPMFS